MKIQYCSDLHLEFPENKNFMEENPIIAEGEVLILAGDIIPFSRINKANEFFDYLSGSFEKVWWIPGNHEYYHYDLVEKKGTFNEQVRDNVHLVNNSTFDYRNVRFVFSTLWSRISPPNAWEISRGLNDFQLIKCNGNRLTPDDYNQLHINSLEFLNNELVNKSVKTVVVTHHVPTFLNYPEKYKADVLNEAFASELFEQVEASQANYWIYGHHHQYVEPFTIGTTTLLTNQLGYVKYGEHECFKRDRCFEI